LHSTASLQGCGGCGRGGVLAPKGRNDKEMRGFFSRLPSGRVIQCRWGSAKLGLQRGDARLEPLVLLARQPRHVLDRLEFLALDDVEVAQDFFGLIADHGVDLALDALGGARGVIHQAPDLVEKPIAGLGHLWGSPVGCELLGQVRQWRSGRPCSRPALPSRGKSACHVPVSLQSYRWPKQKTEKPRSEKQ